MRRHSNRNSSYGQSVGNRETPARSSLGINPALQNSRERIRFAVVFDARQATNVRLTAQIPTTGEHVRVVALGTIARRFCMRPIFRFASIALVALVAFASACAVANAANVPGLPSADRLTIPARPAGARELPPSRIRVTADVDWGIPDRRAVAAFRANRQFAFMKSFGRPDFVEHAGQGYYLLGTATTTFGAYANETVYPKQREPGSPNQGGGFLYAPTMFGPGADCIEAVTVVQNQAPQVWAWDWCSANPNPYAVVNVTEKFRKNYIRKMPDGLREYSVETILASDGVTWDMALHNYMTKKWDIIYQTSGTRNSNYGLGQQGWNFFETYTNVNNGISDVCNPFPAAIAADDISLSFDDKTFTAVTSANTRPLQFADFYCAHFTFSTPKADEWQMQSR